MAENKTVQCSICGSFMRVSGEEKVVGGTCYKCLATNQHLSQKLQEAEEKGEEPSGVLKNFAERKASAAKKCAKKESRTKNSKPTVNPFTPESIRDRFETVTINKKTGKPRKPGYFQRVYNILKAKQEMVLEDLQEAAFQIADRPKSCKSQEAVYKQIDKYAKDIWTKGNLVSVTSGPKGIEIKYLG